MKAFFVEAEPSEVHGAIPDSEIYRGKLRTIQSQIQKKLGPTDPTDRYGIRKHYELYPENLIHMIKLSLNMIRMEVEEGLLNRIFCMKENYIRIEKAQDWTKTLEKFYEIKCHHEKID